MAKFTNKPPDWTATGVEPNNEMKSKGFVAGQKPPAAFFNWFWNKVSACIKELQDKSIGQSGTGIKSEIFNGANEASGNYSHAEGSDNKATKQYAHAEGIMTEAGGDASHSEGGDTKALGNYSHSQGFGTRALGANSAANGARTTALGAYATSNGFATNIATDIIPDLSVETTNEEILSAWNDASERFSLAKGIYSSVNGTNCLALNNGAEASGEACIALNQNTHAEGKYTRAEGLNAHAEGSGSIAKGDNSHSEGTTTEAIGTASHSEGSSTKASGNYSHSEGLQTEARGYVSHSQGCKNTSIGDYAHSEGLSTDKATDIISDLSKDTTSEAIKTAWNEKKFSLAKGTAAHSEGCNNLAIGQGSYAGGNATIAEGSYASTHGNGTIAIGSASNANGIRTTALGNFSNIEGLSTNKAIDVISDLSTSTTNDDIITAWEEAGFSLAKNESCRVSGQDCLALNSGAHAEGKKTISRGQYSHTEGVRTVAKGDFSHAEGSYTNALGQYSHSEGAYTNAVGADSHAEGQKTTAYGTMSHSEGNSTNDATVIVPDLSTVNVSDIARAWETNKFSIAYGNSSHCEGENCLALGSYSHAQGFRTKAFGSASTSMGVNTSAREDYATAMGSDTHAIGIAATATGRSTQATGYAQFAAGKFNVSKEGATGSDDATGTIFIVGCGTGDTARANALRISNEGKCYGQNSFLASGADYAEFYEWADGNSDNEDRRGYFVTLDGNKIRKANAEDSYILGVISATPCVVGNTYSDMWQGMYLEDVFGERLTEVVEVPETTDEETGIVTPAHTVTRFVINPEYDPEQEYVGRDKRKEWAAVGTHGQLVVIDDGTCEVNRYCKVVDGGTVTASETVTDYRVIERLDDTHIRIVIK